MIEFDKFSHNGKTLMAGFECQRCKVTAITTLEESMCNNEAARFLHNLKPPKDWSDHFYGRLLCPECTQKLRDFLNGSADTHIIHKEG